MDEARLQLENLHEDDLANLSLEAAAALADHLKIEDNGFEGSDDLKERLVLTRRKNNNSGHKPFAQFSRVQKEAANKRSNLLEILEGIKAAFGVSKDGTTAPLTTPLSEVLREERLLTRRDLLDELTHRIRALKARKTKIIVAGETNSGKSTFINVLLCMNVLPTDVLHCTYVVCKIVYHHSFSFETMDDEGHREQYFCSDCDEVREKLKNLAACDNIEQRQKSSSYKEITLRVPAEILKSDITLIDTPGIGENQAMDDVTLDFVKRSEASSFIYIIKSDGAGGVQEDRLLAFLKAVKDHYKQDCLEGTFDPQAAMFVCHRWDTINEEEAERVKRNALCQLEIVWPGFQASQTFLFSSKKTNLHLEIDPDYITDSFNVLLNGLKHLIDIATHNVIKYQYVWAKTFLHPACQHLRSMITQCKKSNEALEEHFRDVADKQDCLKKESSEREPLLREKLNEQKRYLSHKIDEILTLTDVSLPTDLDNYGHLLSILESDSKYLNKHENRQRFNEEIVESLIRYCDDHLIREGILKEIEECILEEIQDHLGLFDHQMRHIKKDMQGKDWRRASMASNASSIASYEIPFDVSNSSSLSLSSGVDDLEPPIIPDPIVLKREVDTFLERRKKATHVPRILKSGRKIAKKVIDKIGDHSNANSHPEQYIANRVKTLAADMTKDPNITEGFVNRYLRFSERCIMHAINCIPRFTGINDELMNKIRDHRETFREDKQLMEVVMERIEPFRAMLRGYGSLYMDDVNADQVNFMLERRMSRVQMDPSLKVSVNPNTDSGFIDSDSTKTKVRSFWAQFRIAQVAIDGIKQDVIVKTNMFTVDDADRYSEIAALRCLEHEHVATFFANTWIDCGNGDDSEADPRMPSLIFKGHLWAVSVYTAKHRINFQSFAPTFLLELWGGLDYIHRENLVHLELNLDTVMVDSKTGSVKLCQQCKPRTVTLPADLSVITKAAVCLSHSVLKGNVYGIEDDIYAFGLLLWEFLYPDNLPFAEERHWPLGRFMDESHVSDILRPQLERLHSSSSVKAILEGCLICDSGRTIITMKDIYSFRDDIDRDPALIALTLKLSRRGNACSGATRTNILSQHRQVNEYSYEDNDGANAEFGLMKPPSYNRTHNNPTKIRSSTTRTQNEPANNTAQRRRKGGVIAPADGRRNNRPVRHSEIQAPDLSKLDIPTRHRKMSLPALPQLSANEKCQQWKASVGQTPVQETSSVFYVTRSIPRRQSHRSQTDISKEYIDKFKSPLDSKKTTSSQGQHSRTSSNQLARYPSGPGSNHSGKYKSGASSNHSGRYKSGASSNHSGTDLALSDAESESSLSNEKESRSQGLRFGLEPSSNRLNNSDELRGSASMCKDLIKRRLANSARGVTFEAQDNTPPTDAQLGRASNSDPQVNKAALLGSHLTRHNAMRYRKISKETRRGTDGDLQIPRNSVGEQCETARRRAFSTDADFDNYPHSGNGHRETQVTTNGLAMKQDALGRAESIDSNNSDQGLVFKRIMESNVSFESRSFEGDHLDSSGNDDEQDPIQV